MCRTFDIILHANQDERVSGSGHTEVILATMGNGSRMIKDAARNSWGKNLIKILHFCGFYPSFV